MNKVILATLIVLTAAEISWARRDQVREARQQGRIAEGVKSGELTRPEARRLRHGQHRIDVAQKKAMADGVVTDAEKAKLEKMQDVQNKRIYSQKHDEQKRADTKPAEAPAAAGPEAPASTENH